MRAAFVNSLTELARRKRNIFLLTGDLGFNVLDNFREEFPLRFFNIGVAEANMVGIAAGLALSGKIVYIYSIVPFATMRCFEQIRNDVCHQNLKVRIIGIGGGLCYGPLGMTHHSVEDVAIMRSLPNMTVVCPGDPIETALVIKSSLDYKGPMYIRLGKNCQVNVHSQLKDFKIGKGIILNKGKDLTIIAMGSMLKSAQAVSDKLRNKNLSVRLISMHTIKPLDKYLVIESSRHTKAIFTIEEHSLIGGLGSAVAEILAEGKAKTYFRRIALPDANLREVGSQDYLRTQYDLSIDRITQSILKHYKSI